jgi:hypothetical protein
MTFYIANANPLRFTGGAGNKFDRLFMDQLFNKWQDKKCYLQKWNLGDATKIQVLSDYEFTFEIFDLDGFKVASVEPVEVADNIQGKTFKVYEIPLVFDTAGAFYAVVEYEGHSLISEAWQVGQFTDTMIFKYRNSENNFSILFDTGIEFSFRVEGLIADFEPKSDDVIYNDQLRNSRVLNSTPWRAFTMYAGQAEGIPDWVADKVNRIMACDIVFVDSETFDGYISKVEGAEWEVVRAPEYAFTGLRTQIMPVENNLLERLKRGANATDGTNFKIVQKVDNYFNINGSLPLPATFGKYRLLEKICIEKQALAPAFVLKVGLTNGGEEVARFLVDSPAQTLTINHLFLSEQPVFLTGINSALPFISIIYKNLLEPVTNVGGGEASGEIPVGAVLIYSGTAGRALTDDFDVLTGLGREGTGWHGWALCNGTNGTDDLRDKFVLGYGNGINNVGETGGEKTVTLTVDEMPRHSHEYRNMEGNDSRRGTTGTPFLDFPPNNNKTTGEAGGDMPHNNMPPYMVKAYVQKIF